MTTEILLWLLQKQWDKTVFDKPKKFLLVFVPTRLDSLHITTVSHISTILWTVFHMYNICVNKSARHSSTKYDITYKQHTHLQIAIIKCNCNTYPSGSTLLLTMIYKILLIIQFWALWLPTIRKYLHIKEFLSFGMNADRKLNEEYWLDGIFVQSRSEAVSKCQFWWKFNDRLLQIRFEQGWFLPVYCRDCLPENGNYCARKSVNEQFLAAIICRIG
jgi:hypothetical protein